MSISSVTNKVTNGMRKVLPLKYCGAVIVAAGTASRMGGIDKVMAELDGEPMILRTVRTFATLDAIKEIVIVTREDLVMPIMQLTAEMEKVTAVVVGGASRQAQEQAKQLVTKEAIYMEARKRAEELVGQTQTRIEALKKASNDYMADALRQTEEVIAESLNNVRLTREKFQAVTEKKAAPAPAPKAAPKTAPDVDLDD